MYATESKRYVGTVYLCKCVFKGISTSSYHTSKDIKVNKNIFFIS